jgi:hypothetical protein
MKISRQVAEQISHEVLESLKTIGDKHNIKFLFRGGNFTTSNMTLKIEGAAVSSSGEMETVERTTYRAKAYQYDLKPEWLDQSFLYGGETYKIVGLNTRKHKHPVLCHNERSKVTYMFNSDQVKQMMETRPEAAEKEAQPVAA